MTHLHFPCLQTPSFAIMLYLCLLVELLLHPEFEFLYRACVVLVFLHVWIALVLGRHHQDMPIIQAIHTCFSILINTHLRFVSYVRDHGSYDLLVSVLHGPFLFMHVCICHCYATHVHAPVVVSSITLMHLLLLVRIILTAVLCILILCYNTGTCCTIKSSLCASPCRVNTGELVFSSSPVVISLHVTSTCTSSDVFFPW